MKIFEAIRPAPSSTSGIKKKAIEMPTEITRPSLQPIERSSAPSIGPLAIAAALALVLHIASGVMLDRSHASPAIAPAFAGLDDEAMCPAQVRQPEPSLPYD
jgi:hypothetical protein